MQRNRMPLFSTLIGAAGLAAAANPAIDFMPKPTRRQQAVMRERDAHGQLRQVFDYRALERNKYAPWGRGYLSGLPQHGNTLTNLQ